MTDILFDHNISYKRSFIYLSLQPVTSPARKRWEDRQPVEIHDI